MVEPRTNNFSVNEVLLNERLMVLKMFFNADLLIRRTISQVLCGENAWFRRLISPVINLMVAVQMQFRYEARANWIVPMAMSLLPKTNIIGLTLLKTEAIEVPVPNHRQCQGVRSIPAKDGSGR